MWYFERFWIIITNCSKQFSIDLYGKKIRIDDLMPPTSGANYNHFNQRMTMASENDPNHQIETRTVFYRMPTNSSAPPNSMQSNAPMMMSGMPPRGPPRFNANNNPGKFHSNFSIFTTKISTIPSICFSIHSFIKYSCLFWYLFRKLSNASY